MRISGIVVPLAALAALVACGGGSPMGPSTGTTSPAPPPMPSPSPSATPSPAPSPTPSPTPGPTVLRSASVQGANGHSASGTVQIVRRGASHSLEFLSDFRIDLDNNDIYLTRSTTLDMDRDLKLGALLKTSGAQSYALPDDGSAYRYVMLWCRPFRVPIGIGELR